MSPKSLVLLFRGLVWSAVFLAGVAQAQPRFVLIDLGTLGGPSSTAAAVNDAGQVVGITELPNGDDRAFVWSGGQLTRLDPPGGVISQAFGINQHGVVVGITSATLAGPPRPTRWIAGVAEDLGTLGGPGGYGYAINSAGSIVGNAAPVLGAPHAFLFADGTMNDLGTIAGYGSGALSINDAGWVAGFYYTAPSSTARRVFVRRPGGSLLLPASLSTGPAGAYCINDSGLVVGVSQAADGKDHAFRYDAVAGGALEDLGTAWGSQSIAYWVNEHGWIVGAIGGVSATQAFLFVGDAFLDLNDGLWGAVGWTVLAARSVNNRGWIAGMARNPAGEPRAVLLLPRGSGTCALQNLSVRAGLRRGSTLIAGVVAQGAEGVPVLVRGVGPGLARLLPEGSTVATDPRLTVFDAQRRPSAANDDWSGDATMEAVFTGAGAFTLARGSHDAALVHSVAGATTVHLETSDDGLGLVELYDVRTDVGAGRLCNLSARYLAGSGSDVLIAGFSIDGVGEKALLIRGIGPGLAARGVENHLSSCALAVYDASGAQIARNDAWMANLASVFGAVGAFGLEEGSGDAALVLSLRPGTYTVHLSGGGAALAEGLIEVYDLDL